MVLQRVDLLRCLKGQPDYETKTAVVSTHTLTQLPHIHTITYFEAGGDGGVFIVGRLSVSNKIIPAGEHLPGKGELIVFSIPSPHICVFSHPNSESGLYSTLVENPFSPAG